MPISVLDSRPVQMNVRMDRQLKEAGDAVLAHIGMTPQSVNVFGGFKVQGKGDADTLGISGRQRMHALEIGGCGTEL